MRIVDIHSHILPNMDDGSRSINQSLEMLRIAFEEGISAMIATPHNMPGKGCPSSERIHENIENLQALADNGNIPIQILPGMEYYYREDVLEMLETDAVTLGSSDCVLIEFEPMVEKSYVGNAVRNIMGMGYIPVIAHVERYAKVMKDIDFLLDLKRMGALVQINAASVIGNNGRQAKKDTKMLLLEQLADFVATDAHNDGHRAPYFKKCADILYKKYGKEYTDALLYKNAEYYLMKGMG